MKKLFSILILLPILACSITPNVTAPTAAPPTPVAAAAPAKVEFTINVGAVDSASPIKPLLGVNMGPVPTGKAGNADLTSAYQQLGVNLIRTHDFTGPFDLSAIYKDQNADPANPSSYNFAESDRAYDAILKGGFELYLRVGNSYGNSQKVTNRDNLVKAIVEVVRHFNDDKRWGKKLRYVEIWNEPDNKQFWLNDRAEFAPFFVQAAKAIKTALPEVKVGGPGFTPAGALSPQGQQFTNDLLNQLQKEKVQIDFFSWHVYSNDPQDYATAAVFYREALDKHGYTKTESHISEWNTDTFDRSQPGGKVEVPDAVVLRASAKASAFTTAAWIVLQQKKVDVSTFYRGPDPDINAPQFYGIFYADGKPKPTALAFRLWAKMAAHPTRLALTMNGGDPKSVWTLAGQNASGEIAILIANISDKPSSWQIVPPSGKYTMTLEQVNDAVKDSIQTSVIKEPTANIGAYTVQLVTLTLQK